MADLPGLTGARGILALTVLFYHLGLAPGGRLGDGHEKAGLGCPGRLLMRERYSRRADW